MSYRAIGWAWHEPVGTATQRLALLHLASHASVREQLARVAPAQLAADCGLTQQEANLALLALEARGLIARHRVPVPGAAGDRAYGRYLLNTARRQGAQWRTQCGLVFRAIDRGEAAGLAQ